MSLVQYAVFQATGIALPGDGSQPAGVGTVIAPEGDHRPGRRPSCSPVTPPTGVEPRRLLPLGDLCREREVWDAIGVNQPVQEHSMTYLSTIYTYDGAIRYWTPPTVTRWAGDPGGRDGVGCRTATATG